jgi:hypothetical protein
MQAVNLPSNEISIQVDNLWHKFIEWLYLPSGHMGAVRRLVGLNALAIAMICHVWSRGGPGPYTIPAWRIGSHMLEVPLPPESVANSLLGLVAISACCMIWGFKWKMFPLICAMIIGYFASIDWVIAGSHYNVMEWVMLVALLFDGPGRNPSRRIVQLNVFLCYFITSVQRLFFPDFHSGYSMQAMFADGWALNNYWRDVLHMQDWSHSVWAALSFFTIGFEFFLAFGLFFKRTQKATLIVAALFHLAIAVFLDKLLIVFSIAMWAGLLTFVDKESEKALLLQPMPLNRLVKIQSTACLFFMAFLILFPLRIFLYDRPIDKLCFFDRSPWSFCMFLARQETDRLLVKYEDSQGNWHVEPNRGRMGRISSDNELYGIANWIFKKNSDALKVRIENDIIMNGRLRQLKVLERDRNDHDKQVEVQFLEPLKEMKLQKVDRSTDI